MAHRHDGDDVAVAGGHGGADRHRLGAHRGAADIGVEVEAGVDLARARAQHRGDVVPVFDVARADDGARRFDQRVVFGGEFVGGHRGRERRYITAPICQGTNSSAPKPCASDLLFSPEATFRMRSKISWPFSATVAPPSTMVPQFTSMSSTM